MRVIVICEPNFSTEIANAILSATKEHGITFVSGIVTDEIKERAELEMEFLRTNNTNKTVIINTAHQMAVLSDSCFNDCYIHMPTRYKKRHPKKRLRISLDKPHPFEPFMKVAYRR